MFFQRPGLSVDSAPVSSLATVQALRGGLDAGSAHRLLTEGRMVASVGETEVLVLRTRRGIFAVENRCPHTGRRLDDARAWGRKLTCVGHQRRYDLNSGQPVGRAGPGTTRLRTFEAAVVDNRLWLTPRCRS